MNVPMSGPPNTQGLPSGRLEQYLDALNTRFRQLRYVIAAAALTAAVLIITVLGVYFAMRQGFSAWVVNTARALMLLAVVTLVLWLLVWPLRKLKQDATRAIERRAPDFGGRLDAFNIAREQHNPLTELLAEDTLKVAERFPVEQTIRPRELQLPLIVAAASVITLVWLAIAGPGLWSYGTRYLWAGWAVSNLKPAQSILVKPGDQAVRRGGNVPLLAQMQGFAPSEASVYVQTPDGQGNSQWQQVAMTRTDAGFAFTFFSVREAMKYYVAAAGVRSADYTINVVDLPNINNLKLTYTFPKWTGRKPEVQEPGGDIAALKDTQIDLEISADAPLPQTELVLNDEPVAMSTDGNKGRSDFAVQKEGRYYIAAKVAGESVRLSDDYFIRVLEDAKPEINVVRPGRDYGASSIEEVTARINASDDYGLNAVEMRYAVNGGQWQTVKIAAGRQTVSDDHTFELESLGQQVSDKGEALKPGDLISYYAVAKDHSNTVRTDMYFVDVRPFDKRYSQSQQAGGQGQGQQGEQQGEISQRQREIIVSTWNLIREREGKPAETDKIEDNSRLLSELQTKLAAQASSLTQRMEARELDSTDAQSKEFADNIKLAVASMMPAARALNQVELDEAIGPEQQALQYILRAEAVFNEIQVQQQGQQGQGGQGGQQQDSRDMAQMYELEMDLNKNQYESRNNATPEQQAETQDELEDKLKELARRQQQLANNTRQQQQMTQEQRWQQESLKREAEQLQRQLQAQQQGQQGQQGQQAQNSNQQGQQGQQGQQSGQQGQSGQQSGQQGGQQAGNQPGNQELQQRLQSAIRAMDESANAMRNNSDAGERAKAQRAAAEAQRQLSGASDAVARNQQQAQQNSLSGIADQASRLYEEQAQFDRKLQDAVKQLRAQPPAAGQVDELGLTPQERQLANDKRALSTQLQSLRRDMVNAQRNLKEQAPQTVQQIAEAASELDENKVDQRMSVAATYIERGNAPFIVASESLVTDTLREVRDDLRQAANQGAGSASNNDKADDAVAEVRALRQQLEQLNNQQRAAQRNAQGNNQGNNQSSGQGSSAAGGSQQASNQNSSQQSSGQGQGQAQGMGQGQQQGQGQSQGQQGQGEGQGQGQSGQQAGGGGGGGFTNGWQGINGGNNANPANGTRPDLGGNLNNAMRNAQAAINELNQRGRLTQLEAQQLQDLTQQLNTLRTGSNGTGIRSGAEPTAVALMEQLELRLAQASERKSKSKQTVRSAVTEPVPSDYEDAVAEYYRRLSKE